MDLEGYLNISDDASVERFLKQLEKSGMVSDGVGKDGADTIEGCFDNSGNLTIESLTERGARTTNVEMMKETDTDDPEALKRLVNFWRKKCISQKEAIKKASVIERRNGEFETMHSLDAYRLHRLCGELREREESAKSREQHARKQASEAKRESERLQQELQKISSKYDTSTKEMKDFLQKSKTDGTPTATKTSNEDSDSYRDSLVIENQKLRYDLSVRCKVLWQLSESQRSFESQVADAQAELRKSRQREEIACEMRNQEDRVIQCLTREIEASSEEQEYLSNGIEARDEQIAILTKELDAKMKVVDTLRSEAETRELKLHNLLVNKVDLSSADGGTHSQLIVDNEALRQRSSDLQSIIDTQKATIFKTQSEQASQQITLASEAASEAAERRKTMLELQAKVDTANDNIASLKQKLLISENEVKKLKSSTEIDRYEQLEEETNIAQLEVTRYQREESRLKHYITTLGSKLDAMSGELEEKNAKVCFIYLF